jgi:hypothetical protein
MVYKKNAQCFIRKISKLNKLWCSPIGCNAWKIITAVKKQTATHLGEQQFIQ